MNMVKEAWAALKPKKGAGLKFRTANVEPCGYCGAEEPCAWLNLSRTYECKSAYLFCPVCGQDGPKAPTLEAAKGSWDAEQRRRLQALLEVREKMALVDDESIFFTEEVHP